VSTRIKFNYTCGHSGIRTSLCSVLSLGVSISMNSDAYLRWPRCHKFVRLFWQICWLGVSTLGIRKDLALLYHSENEPQRSTCKDMLQRMTTDEN
jgi:hypothetical protein